MFFSFKTPVFNADWLSFEESSSITTSDSYYFKHRYLRVHSYVKDYSSDIFSVFLYISTHVISNY